MGQVHVLALGLDEAEQRLSRNGVLTDPSRGLDVPVLERATVPALDGHAAAARPDDRAGRDRIHGRSVGCRDVEALVERESAVALEDRLLRARALEHGARIAEATANRMRAVERLHRPAVATRAAGARRTRLSDRVEGELRR